jgi:hypothetical protein
MGEELSRVLVTGFVKEV